MKEDTKNPAELEAVESDDIEIIEVVGLNDDAPPPSDRDPDEVEVSFDESEGRVAVETPPEQTAQPQSVAAERDDSMRERLLRLQADFENYKKRMDRERGDYHRHATATLVAKLLPVIDNFERALATEPRSEGECAMHQGIALIHRQMMDELKREGLEPLESIGEIFDPSRHEAVATDASSGQPPNTVVEEIQRGYFFQDRLLRPAAVRVSVDPDPHAAVDPFEES
jgi:molecular chaperone GrpE